MRKYLTIILLFMFCSVMYGQNKATVSLSCNIEGAAELSGAGTYSIGTMLNVTATTNPGYTFVNWTKDEEIVSTDMSYTFEVTKNVELVANLTPNHWMPNSTSYSDNMTLIAVIEIDGEEQRSIDYEIGAFCGDEVRSSQRMIHEYIENNGNVVVDRYIGYLTIYGKDNDIITFKLYNHETETEYDESDVDIVFANNTSVGDLFNPHVLSFSTPQNAPTFIGSGLWSDISNWDNSTLPIETDDVIIDGFAILSDEISINSLIINEGKSLTIDNGAVLTVKGAVTNTDVDALVINEGGQIVQSNDNVAATFKNNIVSPEGSWGEEDYTGWQFVSSPMKNSSISDFTPESGDYDIYKYDGSLEYQWYNFKKSIKYTFDNDMEGCTTKDVDGDGHDWILTDGYVYSESYDLDNDEELSPDNYLIFPAVNPATDGSTFKFKARAEDDYYHEYCGVAVSEDGNNFTMIKSASWWIGEGIHEGEPSQWYEKTVDLSEYAGKEIYVAIRHYNVTGSYNLIIDDVEFFRDEESFENGTAYLVSYETETTADFKGILNKESSYKLTVAYSSGNKWTNFKLVGNPFAYDINWTTDVKLVGCNEGYATLNENGGYDYKTDGTIKVGEGFMINSKSGRTHNITFQKGINSAKRSADNSINIVASGKYGSDNVIIRHGENEDTDGFVKLENFNDKIANIYVKSNDNNYAIFNCNEDVSELPLYFDAKEMGNYTLSFDVKGNYDNLYLIDKMTGEKVNLLIENEYSFIANSNESSNRFIISFANSQQPKANGNFAYVSGEDLIINAEGTIMIIDMMGRVVMTEDNHNGSINISKLKNAAYIVRCVNENEVKTQKIVVL